MGSRRRRPTCGWFGAGKKAWLGLNSSRDTPSEQQQTPCAVRSTLQPGSPPPHNTVAAVLGYNPPLCWCTHIRTRGDIGERPPTPAALSSLRYCFAPSAMFQFLSHILFFFFNQRSSTGTTGKSISKTRTSDNAFVTHTKTAQALKRRIFQLLGIEEYRESWADGLQVGGKCFGYVFLLEERAAHGEQCFF